MPTGTPYSSLVYPYRIRVDDFASNVQPPPLLHLLTHTHSDHLNGLAAKSFGHNVYCSSDSKEILLRHQVYAEREYHETNLRAEKIRTFSHLKVGPMVGVNDTRFYQGSRDLLKPLPLNTSTELELDANESVTITPIDANHCPGAVMYLIEGKKGAILHTGDFRAEPWFIDSLRRNPILQPYIYHESLNSASNPITKTLEAIYLDTACVLSNVEIPAKESATSGLVTLMQLFPSTAYFFLNVWTLGYEDILKAIAANFQTKIHVDRYKHSLYEHISDSWLRSITTQDPSATRFHACERFSRCEHVKVENPVGTYANTTSVVGKRVIYVNPVSMDIDTWNLYLRETAQQLKDGHVVNILFVPLARHSTLPELRRFVSVFRPKCIIPNTLEPRLHGLDWTCIDRMFRDCLHPAASLGQGSHTRRDDISGLDETACNDGDVALKNLVGEGAEALATKWADSGKLLHKIDILRSWLGSEENDSIERLLGIRSLSPDIEEIEDVTTTRGRSEIKAGCDKASDEDTDHSDLEDERGWTAHRLFAPAAGPNDKENMWLPPSSSPLFSDVDHDMVANIERTPPTAQLVRKRLNERLPTVENTGCADLLTPSATPALRHDLLKRAGTAPFVSPLARRPVKHSVALFEGEGTNLASPINLCSSPAPSNAGSQNFVTRLLNIASPSKHTLPGHLTSSSKHVNRDATTSHRPQPMSQSLPSIFSSSKPASFKPQSIFIQAHPSRKAKRKRAVIEAANSSPKRRKEDSTQRRNPISVERRRALRLNLSAAKDQLASMMGGDAHARLKGDKDRLVPSVISPLKTASSKRKSTHESPTLGSAGTVILVAESHNSYVNWDQSRELAFKVKEDMTMGRPLSLPSLTCMQKLRDADSASQV